MEGQRFETNRVKLSDQLPLDTPYSVTMVPSSLCNFACTFCPARIIRRKAKIIPLQVATRIIDRANFPRPVKMLSLYNVGEPLLNEDLPLIISHAKERKFCERTSLVTNAVFLTPEKSRQLVGAGLDRLIISIYGLNDIDYELVTNRKASFDQIWRNVRYFYGIKAQCHVHVKIIDRVATADGRQDMFKSLFRDICDTYSIEPILPIWPSFRPEGEDPLLKRLCGEGLYKGVPAVDRLACHYPFYSMVVTSGGKVTPCLADWNESLVLGNVTGAATLNTVWNSLAYQDFRFSQLAGKRRDHYLCSTCGTLRTATCPEDDIDGDRVKLLNKLFPGGQL